MGIIFQFVHQYRHLWTFLQSSNYDLNIMKDNVDFMPFALEGIVAKHLINKMIYDNSSGLQQRTDKLLNLNSVYNNTNCIISNLTSNNYEMIDCIITNLPKLVI